ncbi:UNVERIFIED_CONTAM: hypothetical protein FKN15_005110 [Acipenser sinensis]
MAALDIERCELECEKNNFGHRTYLNCTDRLIVRRGQPFNITLHLRSGQFQPGVTTFSFVAETGDSVYMEDEEELKEYVLTQDGLIFRGTEKHITHCAWNFGQFEPGILDACLQLLDMNPKFFSNADQDCSKRNDPIYVSRVVSAMINCNDDKGVLAGNWGDCCDGVSPMSWNGSVEILRNWSGSYCQPVKYGQCWVFAAVGCTVLRALGIPSRVVTNFLSAHDSNSNLIIERYYDENGTIIKKTRDSICLMTLNEILLIRYVIKMLLCWSFKILGEPKQDRKLAAEITLKNPLSEPLQGCLFCVEGANLTDGKAIQEPIALVSPGQEAKVKVYFTPKQSGLRKLVVDFNSNKLRDVKGYRNIIIGK